MNGGGGVVQLVSLEGLEVEMASQRLDTLTNFLAGYQVVKRATSGTRPFMGSVALLGKIRAFDEIS